MSVTKTQRELSIYMLGQLRGYVNLFMSMAASKSRSPTERCSFIREARRFHHEYLAKKRALLQVTP